MQNLTINSVNFAQSSYGSMYSVNPPVQNSITGWTTITGFTAGDASTDITFASNTLNKISASGIYLVSFSASFSASVTGTYELGISINNADPVEIRVLRYLANNDAGNASATGYLTLNSGDLINLKILPPSSANLTIRNASVSLVRLEDISSYNSYAEMGFYNNSTPITLSTSYSTITNAGYSSTNNQDWTHSAGVLTAGTGSAGVYLVSTSVSFNGATGNTTYDIGISKNDGDPSEIIGGRKTSNQNDIGNISIWGLVTIADGNTIRLKAKADGINKDLTVQYCHIYLTKISGSGNTPEDFPYASMSISTTTPTPIPITAAVNNKITGFANDVTDINYWSLSNSEFSPVGISAGYYRINYYISCVTSSATTVTFRVLNNGSPIQQLTNVRTTSSSTDRGAISGNGIILISNPTDIISLTANPLDNVNLSVYRSRLSLSRIEKTNDVPLPVELSSFSAVVLNNGIKLNWRTETEVNNYGFEILRQAQDDYWQKLGFVEGHGNSNSPKEYSFIDDNTTSGKYVYKLKQVDNDGTFEYSKLIEVNVNIPLDFELSQNYPNPFNPSTVIKFAMAESQKATLTVYDILGNAITELFNEITEAGKIYEIEFDAGGLSSGVYYYQLSTPKKSLVRKMLLLR